jgi:two-component system, cell cycle sensor histidine kinase and response regulator CckA
MLRRLLKSMGYKVIDAEHGRHAKYLFDERAGDIDLLITDVMMPEMNGIELYKALVKEKPGLKVLFITGYAGDTPEDEKLSAEGMPLLHKPFSTEALALKIREVLDADKTAEPPSATE